MCTALFRQWLPPTGHSALVCRGAVGTIVAPNIGDIDPATSKKAVVASNSRVFMIFSFSNRAALISCLLTHAVTKFKSGHCAITFGI